jgi:hypothetical protein
METTRGTFKEKMVVKAIEADEIILPKPAAKGPSTPIVNGKTAIEYAPAERCENCRFALFPGADATGFCRINPPTAVIIPLGQNKIDPRRIESTTLSAWPPVMRNQWCGKWEKKAE